MSPVDLKTATHIANRLKYNPDGLIPAIAQQAGTLEVLMMAWMNIDAVIETLTTGRVCYFSRSRSKLWRKGERSGQVQMLSEFRWDCDDDTVLMLVEQHGVACHTGRQNCFYNAVRDGAVSIIADVKIDPDDLYS
ncbi:MAG: phosphoribosyl-AMP cyclohydrolase [Magnetovibrio sp.]|nr:phosphoribosyl-AMP cyclohydrolase [Magnetovibrio sp.]